MGAVSLILDRVWRNKSSRYAPIYDGLALYEVPASRRLTGDDVECAVMLFMARTA